jgi:hypothetical protein|tara:strand:- start:192 stop:428 length:237 start_codon:yes stop_codon:yes gene_type:complete
MGYPDKKKLVDKRKLELEKEAKDKKLVFHYYQSSLNNKNQLETMTWNKFESNREEIITAKKKLTDKQIIELRKRGYDV